MQVSSGNVSGGGFVGSGNVSGVVRGLGERFRCRSWARGTFPGHFWARGTFPGSFVGSGNVSGVICGLGERFRGHLWARGTFPGSFVGSGNVSGVICGLGERFRGHFWARGTFPESFVGSWNGPEGDMKAKSYESSFVPLQMELESKDLKIEQLNAQLKSQASVSANSVDDAPSLELAGTHSQYHAPYPNQKRPGLPLSTKRILVSLRATLCLWLVQGRRTLENLPRLTNCTNRAPTHVTSPECSAISDWNSDPVLFSFHK